MVKKNGLELENLPTHFKKDREIVIAAVRSDGFAIVDADSKFLDDKEIAIEAIKNNTGVFLLLNKNLKCYKSYFDNLKFWKISRTINSGFYFFTIIF